MLSVVVPSCREQFLQKTIDSILSAAAGDIEVIAYLDGYWPSPAIQDDKRVHLIHDPVRRGRRAGTNAAASIAKGKYLLKCDAHCAFAPGFDTVLTAECDSDWVVIPRRYSLDVDTWGIEQNGKVRDAHYLSHPEAFIGTALGAGMHIKDWPERASARKDVLLDDEMVSQGSCWMMHREYYRRFGGLSEVGYGIWEQDFQEVGLRCWLSGGTVKVNKKTWYAHLWKGNRFGRGYDLDKTECRASVDYSTDFWYNNRWPERNRDLEWLIDKFWPVPTWPDGWKGDRVQTISAKVSVESVGIPDTQDYIMRKFGLFGSGRLGIPNYTRQDMGKLFRELGFRVGAEIGTHQGEFARQLCDANPGVKLICVDPWEKYGDYGDPTAFSAMSLNEEIARKRLTKRGCTFIKKYSVEASKDIPDESLDFVYIDANHRYEYVVADLAAWSKKVRKGGIVSGHDYKLFVQHSPCMAVKEAVDGWVAANEIDTWFIFQTNLVDKHIRNRAGSFMWVKK